MLKQEIPKLGVLLRECQVSVGQPAKTLLGCATGIDAVQALSQPVEQPCFDGEHEIVEVVENIVERAGRVIDALGNFACGQSGQAVVVDYIGCRLNYEFTQLVGRMD